MCIQEIMIKMCEAITPSGYELLKGKHCNRLNCDGKHHILVMEGETKDSLVTTWWET